MLRVAGRKEEKRKGGWGLSEGASEGEVGGDKEDNLDDECEEGGWCEERGREVEEADE